MGIASDRSENSIDPKGAAGGTTIDQAGELRSARVESLRVIASADMWIFVSCVFWVVVFWLQFEPMAAIPGFFMVGACVLPYGPVRSSGRWSGAPWPLSASRPTAFISGACPSSWLWTVPGGRHRTFSVC
jgi:hypothetical protein